MGWLTKLDRAISGVFLHRVSQAMPGIALVFVIIIGIANFVTVVTRRLGLAGGWLSGGVELTELSMVIVSIAAIAYVWYRGGHVRVMVIRERLNPRVQAIMDAATALFFLIWIALITWGAWRMTMESLAVWQRTMGVRLPIVPFQFAFLVVLGHFVLVLLRSFIGFAVKASGHPVEHEGLY
tara:strand:+ start:372 stop:914 length:543 start_codon:yes stop_codon:yes gene_type:complete